MKIKPLIFHIGLAFFLLQGGLAQTTKIDLKLRQPIEGKTYDKNTEVSLSFEHLKPIHYKAKISLFGMTHYYSITQKEKRIFDPYFPASPGAHTMQIFLYSWDNPDELLLKKEIHFTLTLPKKKRTENPIHFIQLTLDDLQSLENSYQALCAYSSDPTLNAIRLKVADQLFNARLEYAKRMISSITSFAYRYASDMDLNHALALLETAQRLYENDYKRMLIHPIKGNVSEDYLKINIYPPSFFTAMIRLYARAGYPEKTLYWCQRKINFYQNTLQKNLTKKQRYSVTRNLYYQYNEIAFFALLLNNNEEAWATYNQKSLFYKKISAQLKPPQKRRKKR